MAVQIHHLRSTPAPDMQARLVEFERQFDYPLGPEQRFYISHGDDYTRFFRAMGEAVCLVAEDAGNVVGTLAVVTRQLATPSGLRMEVTYLADLKIAPKARGGFVLKRLARAAQAISRTTAGFSVVMHGTKTAPGAYTNRIGIPAFQLLGEIGVLRIPVEGDGVVERHSADEVTPSEADEVFFRLSRGAYAAVGGAWSERSLRAGHPPVGLVSSDGNACGVLEDTLNSKRLFIAGGDELRSAHLSNFAFSGAKSGAGLLRAALLAARERNLPALFTAVPAGWTDALLKALRIEAATHASAGIYGVGLDAGSSWNINTAEI